MLLGLRASVVAYLMWNCRLQTISSIARCICAAGLATSSLTVDSLESGFVDQLFDISHSWQTRTSRRTDLRNTISVSASSRRAAGDAVF